jgi:hypothetical protein
VKAYVQARGLKDRLELEQSISGALPMGTDSFLIVAGAVFGLLAVLQIARLAFRWPVRVGSLDIPLAASWIAVLVAGGLCIWAFRLASF